MYFKCFVWKSFRDERLLFLYSSQGAWSFGLIAKRGLWSVQMVWPIWTIRQRRNSATGDKTKQFGHLPKWPQRLKNY